MTKPNQPPKKTIKGAVRKDSKLSNSKKCFVPNVPIATQTAAPPPRIPWAPPPKKSK